MTFHRTEKPAADYAWGTSSWNFVPTRVLSPALHMFQQHHALHQGTLLRIITWYVSMTLPTTGNCEIEMKQPIRDFIWSKNSLLPRHVFVSQKTDQWESPAPGSASSEHISTPRDTSLPRVPMKTRNKSFFKNTFSYSLLDMFWKTCYRFSG